MTTEERQDQVGSAPTGARDALLERALARSGVQEVTEWFRNWQVVQPFLGHRLSDQDGTRT